MKCERAPSSDAECLFTKKECLSWKFNRCLSCFSCSYLTSELHYYGITTCSLFNRLTVNYNSKMRSIKCTLRDLSVVVGCIYVSLITALTIMRLIAARSVLQVLLSLIVLKHDDHSSFPCSLIAQLFWKATSKGNYRKTSWENDLKTCCFLFHENRQTLEIHKQMCTRNRHRVANASDTLTFIKYYGKTVLLTCMDCSF